MDTSYTATAVVIGGLSLLRQLGGCGIPLLVIPRSHDDICIYSRYFKNAGITMEDLKSDPDYFLNSLIEISKGLKDKPVLYYGDDTVLLFLVDHHETLSHYYRFSVPNQEILEACYHKYDFIRVAQKYGLPIPISLVSSDSLDCMTIDEEIGFPCVFKPNSHIGWFESDIVRDTSNMPQKVLLANNSGECARALSGISDFTDKFIVQEYIPGNEGEIYSFHAYVSQSGESIGAFVGKKIRTYPSVGGESSYIKLIKNDRVKSLGLEVVDALKISGVIKIDFKKDARNGRLYVLEINLRFNLWDYLGAKAGINLALISYRDLCGLPVQPINDYQSGLHWLNFATDLRSFIKDYRPTNQITTGQWIRSLIGKPKIYSVFVWNDPMPFLVSLYKSGKQYIRKFLRHLKYERTHDGAF